MIAQKTVIASSYMPAYPVQNSIYMPFKETIEQIIPFKSQISKAFSFPIAYK